MEQNCESSWNACLEIIRDNITPTSYKTWFEPIEPISLKESVLTLKVPSHFFYEWLEENYVKLIRTTIKHVLGENGKIQYRVVVDKSNEEKGAVTVDYPNYKNGNQMNPSTSMPLNINDGLKNPFIIPGIRKIQIDSKLNPNYTFDSFVEGSCNRLARSAGFAVASKPGGTAFNPLVLHGKVGMGKTHLAHAIGNQVKDINPNLTVLYVRSTEFMNQFYEAVKNNHINDFVYFYQLIDVLIIDDVHFFSGKTKTQDCFFQIFNHLHQNGKQLILTSDRAPKDLEDMEERLLSRFKWGLTTDIEKPDFDTRVAILEKKLKSDGFTIPKDIIDFIAYNIDTNVRELEGAMISFLAHSSLNNQEITIDLAKSIVKNFVKSISREISIDLIVKTVCEHYKVPIDAVKDKTRKRNVVQARQLSMFLSKRFTAHSLKSIGAQFGGRDHSTVIHSCQAVQSQIELDDMYKDEVDNLVKKVQISFGI